MDNMNTPSVFAWNTGQPSIFGGLQKDASISKRAAEKQSTRFRPDPVRLVKKVRNGSGRTIPLKVRIDLQAVYEYRMSGKSWEECACQFKCSTKHIHAKMVEAYPELRRRHYPGSKPGRKPVALDIEQICADIVGGMTIRAAARKRGLSHVSLGYRLRQTPEGMAAVSLARQRSAEANKAAKEAAQDRRNRCEFSEQGAADLNKVANKLSTGSKAAANRLLSCESTGN